MASRRSGRHAAAWDGQRSQKLGHDGPPRTSRTRADGTHDQPVRQRRLGQRLDVVGDDVVAAAAAAPAPAPRGTAPGGPRAGAEVARRGGRASAPPGRRCSAGPGRRLHLAHGRADAAQLVGRRHRLELFDRVAALLALQDVQLVFALRGSPGGRAA